MSSIREIGFSLELYFLHREDKMSLNLKINIKSPKGIPFGEVELPQINTENTLAIIGKDNNVENQIERLIEYFNDRPHLNYDYTSLRGMKNLEFTFI